MKRLPDRVINLFLNAIWIVALAGIVIPRGAAGASRRGGIDGAIGTPAPADSLAGVAGETAATPDTTVSRSGPRLPTPRVTATPDSTERAGRPARPDTLRVPLRRVRQAGAPRKGGPIWWTTVRSGILPGWGQLANGKPVKAVLLAGIYTALAVSAYNAEKDRKDLKRELAGGNDPALVARLNGAVDRRNQKLWFMGATALYAMLDAYVDAHFVGYGGEWSATIRPNAAMGSPGGELAMTVRF